MIRILFALLLSLTVQTWSQEDVGEDFNQQDPYLSDLYMKGSYLLYDCTNQHWVCTAKEEFERCGRWREEAMEAKAANLRCARFSPFESLEACAEKQIQMMPSAAPERFCLHPEIRQDQVHY